MTVAPPVPDPPLARALAADAREVVALVGPDGTLGYVSPAAETVLGYTPGALAGADALARLHPDDAARALGALADLLARPGGAAEGVYRVRHADGSWRTVEVWARNLAHDPEVGGVVVHARDVTAHDTAERRYRSVLEALPDVVSHLRHDGLVLDFHVPDTFETEFPAEHLIGQRLHDVIPGPLAAAFDDAVARVRATGRVASYHYRVTVGGAERHREVRLSPLGDDTVISMLRDVTDLRRHEAALEASEAALRDLARRLRDVREGERARLARDVHDVLGQQLTAVTLEIAAAERRLADGAGDPAVHLAGARALADAAIADVRRIASDLRPGVLDDLGLVAALDWEAATFATRSGLACTFTDSTDGADVPLDVATELFRVFQELLTNVARHAGATRVDAVLMAGAGGALCLTVADDGRGLAPSSLDAAHALGVLGMRERVRPFGGTVAFAPAPGGGTRVDVALAAPRAPLP